MKIAVPTRNGVVDSHFGHCEYYTVYTLDAEKNIISTERLDSPQGCGCKSGIAAVMQQMGITLMLAGNMGQGAFAKLAAHGISVVRGCEGDINDVVQSYINGTLTDSGDMCDHHECHDHNETPVFRIG